MSENEYKELVEHSLVLEGMNRHASIHAAGVVIAPGDLTNYVPLYKSSSGDVTTQYDMKGLEDLGLLKMDFLGLRNLTVINKALNLIELKGEQVEIDKVSMEEPEVYKLFANGLTIGVFQFESSGMREFLKKLKPTAIGDLIAMNALYRPGPMNNIDNFILNLGTSQGIREVIPEVGVKWFSFENVLKQHLNLRFILLNCRHVDHHHICSHSIYSVLILYMYSVVIHFLFTCFPDGALPMWV